MGKFYRSNLDNDQLEVRTTDIPVGKKVSPEVTSLLSNLNEAFKEPQYVRDGKQIIDKKTGLKFHIVIDAKTKEVSVCFYGLGMGKTTGNKGIKAALKDFLGGKPKAALLAREVGAKVQNICNDLGFTPVMVGHSHGGGLAQFAAASNGIKGVVFNSRPLGIGLKKMLMKEGKINNENNIYHFSGKGDPLTDNKFFNLLAKGIKKLAGQNAAIPQNIGHQYKMKQSGKENTAFARHNGYVAQIEKAAEGES